MVTEVSSAGISIHAGWWQQGSWAGCSAMQHQCALPMLTCPIRVNSVSLPCLPQCVHSHALMGEAQSYA